MTTRRKALTEADRQAWTLYTRTLDPLRHLSRAAGEVVARSETGEGGVTTKPPQPTSPSPPRRLPPPKPTTPPLLIGSSPGGVDTATWQRFRTGKLAAARKLDLHGMTAQRAFHSLTSFLHTAHADRLRCVEIVTGRGSGEGTGRGSGEGTGVIRRELPLWLNLPSLRPLVLAAAHPHAANPGSVRLLLRRIR